MRQRQNGLVMVNGTEDKDIVQWSSFPFFFSFNTQSLPSCIYEKEVKTHLHCKGFIFPLE